MVSVAVHKMVSVGTQDSHIHQPSLAMSAQAVAAVVDREDDWYMTEEPLDSQAVYQERSVLDQDSQAVS